MSHPLHAPLHYGLRFVAMRVAQDTIDPDQLKELAGRLVAMGLQTPALSVMATTPARWDHQEMVLRMDDVLEELGYPPLEPEAWWLGPPAKPLWDAIIEAAPSVAVRLDLTDLDFMIAGDLARELVRRVAANRDDDEVRNVFDVVEDQLDALVHLRELVLTGVLEGLAGDIDDHEDLRSGDFERMFGPTTRRFWRMMTGDPDPTLEL